MKLGKISLAVVLLSCLCPPALHAQTWNLSQGPRVRDSIPLPVLWIGEVWEAEYSGSGGTVRVFGLAKGPFLLEGGEPLECPGLVGSQKTYPEGIYVHLKPGFLVIFSPGFPGICPFLEAFQGAWERFQSLSYYRGRITLPHRITTPGSQP